MLRYAKKHKKYKETTLSVEETEENRVDHEHISKHFILLFHQFVSFLCASVFENSVNWGDIVFKPL